MARRRSAEPTANPVRGAILVGVAVVIGLLLLRNGLDTSETVAPTGSDSSSDSGDSGSDSAATDEGTDTTDSTVPVRTAAEVAAIVLNDSGITGAAGRYSDALAAAGYQLTNSKGDTATTAGDAAATLILYTPGFEREAVALAATIGAPTTSVAQLGTTLPGTISGANVIVVLGTDLANIDPPATGGATSGSTTAGLVTDG